MIRREMLQPLRPELSVRKAPTCCFSARLRSRNSLFHHEQAERRLLKWLFKVMLNTFYLHLSVNSTLNCSIIIICQQVFETAQN